MRKSRTKLSATETLEIIDNQWADTKDIKKLGSVGDTKAKVIREEITNKYLEEHPNKKLPYKLVRMQDVVDYFGINISSLKKLANK